MGAPKKNQNARKDASERKARTLTIPLTEEEFQAMEEDRKRLGIRKRAQWGRQIIIQAIEDRKR